MTETLLKTYRELAQAPIENAQCLPFGVYHDEAVHQQEMRQIFHNDWVFACAADRLKEPGDYFAFDLAGEQIVLLRSKSNERIVLSNICRHRGTPLLDIGFGKLEKNIVCPYHAWTYADSGELLGVPFEGSCKLAKEQHSLPHFHLHEWRGLLFVNLSSSAQPFANKVAKTDLFLEKFELERFQYSYQTTTEHWQANWKLVVENAIESYHLFKVHKQTLEQVTPTKSAYYVAGNAHSSLSGGAMKGTQSTLSKWFSGANDEVYNQYLLVFLPPSFIAIISYEGFDWIHVMPEGNQQCSVTPGGLSKSPVKNFKSADFQFSDAFMLEDKILCERLQRGMESNKSSGGKLVDMEKIIADFHQYLGNKLFDSPISDYCETEQADMFLK
jgi:phenylpropionate dioxygenase-like ring-hydroxylating dioxygenase large terminal subunit